MSMAIDLDYHSILQDEYETRVRTNPLYSMRAYARDLGMTASQLSMVLSKKRGLSEAKAAQIARALDFGPNEKTRFLAMVRVKHSRSPRMRMLAKDLLARTAKISVERMLDRDAFKFVSDWYHLAIREVLLLSKEPLNTKMLSIKLSVSEKEITEALSRLERLHFIQKTPLGWEVKKESIFVPSGVPNEAIRKFHRQILDRATKAVSLQSTKERYLHTSMIPVRSKDLPKAAKMIEEFHETFKRKFLNSEDGDEVYSLSMQYFRLTNNAWAISESEKTT